MGWPRALPETRLVSVRENIVARSRAKPPVSHPPPRRGGELLLPPPTPPEAGRQGRGRGGVELTRPWPVILADGWGRPGWKGIPRRAVVSPTVFCRHRGKSNKTLKKQGLCPDFLVSARVGRTRGPMPVTCCLT